MRYLEAAIGFEPMNNGFANRRLRPLGYAAFAGVYRLCSRSVGGAFPVKCPSTCPSQTGNRPVAWSNTGFSEDIIADLPGIVKSRACPAIFTLSHLVSSTAVLPALSTPNQAIGARLQLTRYGEQTEFHLFARAREANPGRFMQRLLTGYTNWHHVLVSGYRPVANLG